MTLDNDLQADLAADLAADLRRPAPVPSAPLAPAPVPGGTPAVSVVLTPLRWSRPSFDATGRGVGVAVLVGPWRVEVAF